ncbi:hypothetical protein Illi2_00083 [Pseudomonas phage vB_PpuM-Illi-2]
MNIKEFKRPADHIWRGHPITKEQFRIIIDIALSRNSLESYDSLRGDVDSEEKFNAAVEEALEANGCPVPEGQGEWTLEIPPEVLEAHANADCQDRRWLSDQHKENGNYGSICYVCKTEFVGSKNRNACKLCHDMLREMKQRRDFEFHAKENLGLSIHRLATGDYQSFGAQMAWDTWQYLRAQQ